MKYRVGQKVKVKAGLIEREGRGNKVSINSEMVYFSRIGKVLTISQVVANPREEVEPYYKVIGSSWIWTDEMLYSTSRRKTKMTKNVKHKIKLNRHSDFTDDEDVKLYLKVEIDAKMRELLKLYSVECEDDLVEGDYGTRYRVKNIIANCSSWKSYYFLFFNKELIDTGKTQILLRNQSSYNDLVSYLSEFNQIVRQMYDLKTEDEVEYEINIKEKKYVEVDKE